VLPPVGVLQTSMLATSPHARWETYPPTAQTCPLLLVLVVVSLDATAPATPVTFILEELAAQVGDDTPLSMHCVVTVECT